MRIQALPPEKSKHRTRLNFEKWKKDKQKQALQARAKASKPEPDQMSRPKPAQQKPEKEPKAAPLKPKQEKKRVTFTDHMGTVYVKPEDSTESDEDWLYIQSLLADDR